MKQNIRFSLKTSKIYASCSIDTDVSPLRVSLILRLDEASVDFSSNHVWRFQLLKFMLL